MNEQVLSIEQMQELEELGIDTSKASMCWGKWSDTKEYNLFAQSKANREAYIQDLIKHNCIDEKDEQEYVHNTISTFTLQDILVLLPKFINKGNVYFLTLMYDVSDGVVISYCTERIMNILHSEGNSNQLNAAFDMLKWCKQNNYI